MEARTKDIEGVAGQLKKFNLDEYLGEGTETTSSVPWAIGDDAVPDPAVVGSSSVMALVGSSEVRVLVVMDYQRLKDGNAVLKDASRLLEQALPGISVVIRACYGPFEDDEGCCSHFDGAVARLSGGSKKTKRVRIDLLTSAAKTLRESAAFRPDLVLGFGQGGVIAGLLRYPLLVELVLQARNLQNQEVQAVGAAWSKIKAVFVVNPRMWRTQLGATDVKEALPELRKDFVVDPLNGFGVATKTGRPDELDAMFEALRLEKVTSIAAVGIRGMLAEPARDVWEHDGLCSCGKKTYLFSRCPACIEKEAQDEVVEMQERAEAAAEDRDLEDGLDLALEVGALVVATDGPFGFKRLPYGLVKQWAVSGCTTEDRTQAAVRLGVLEVRKWKKGVKIAPAASKCAEYPFVTGWVLVSDDCLLNLHHCCKKSNVQEINFRWSLEYVNWHNHRLLVDRVCSRMWEDPKSSLPVEFTRILGLIGEIFRIEGWNDGNGQESLGHRKSLRNHFVLACFSLMPTGHWHQVTLSRRITIQEGSERRTIAFVGREWVAPRTVVYLHSKEWIHTDWAEPVQERKVAVMTAASDVAERDRLAEEARARLGISEFHVTGSLRSAWYEAQRRDGSLAGILRKTEHPFVLGGDGLLEREVQLTAGRVVRVAVVPNGVAGANGLTWRRACYNQVHCGILGAHRSAKVTAQLLERVVWWPTLQEDVKRWTETCLSCLKGRGRPTRVEGKAVKCSADCCWQEVSVDCEGPNREDRHGCRYSLTYFCCLSHAVMLEPLKSLTHAEVRRGFSRCVLRSRTIPTLLRSDRGVEFRNGLMAELTALLGIQQRFSMALRPCEMGSNERMHQEVQKVLGALVREVGSLENWSDWLVVAEYVLDNTPGPHGFTPRDLERSWSLCLPLEKDVLRHTLEFEPVSDWAQRQFSGFKEIAALVSKHWDKASEARSKLANRFRRQIDLKVGDRVVWKSPTARPEGAGRVPWKPGLNGPWEVVRVQGNRLLLRPCRPELPQKDLEAHAEDCILVPADADVADNREPVVFEDPKDDEEPSLGQQAGGESKQLEFTLTRRGKAYTIRIGDKLAYRRSRGDKCCNLGRVTQVDEAQAQVSVHRYVPEIGGIRVKWRLAFLNEEGKVSAEGTKPILEPVKVVDIISKVDLNRDGVLAAASSRKLDKGGYHLQDPVGVLLTPRPLEHISSSSSVLRFLDKELEFLGEACSPSGCLSVWTSGEGRALDAWLRENKFSEVDFIEIFSGSGHLSSEMRRSGLSVAPGIDREYESYGRRWDLVRIPRIAVSVKPCFCVLSLERCITAFLVILIVSLARARLVMVTSKYFPGLWGPWRDITLRGV